MSALSSAIARVETLEKPFCGFKSASGAHLKIPSVESLTRAKRLIEECKDAAKESGTIAVVKTEAVGSLEMPSRRLLNRANHLLDSSDLSTVYQGNILVTSFNYSRTHPPTWVQNGRRDHLSTHIYRTIKASI